MTFNAASQILGAMFEWTWRTLLHASVLIMLVTLIQAAGGKRLAARWRYALGLLVLLRLMMPVVPASSFSIFNLTAPVLPNTPELRASTSLLPATPLSPAASGQVAPLRAALRAQNKIDWLKVAPVLWLLGATGSLVIVLCQQRNFSRRIKYQPPISDERILSLLESCRNVMGVRRRITAVIAPQPGTPALFGFLKPRLLLPESALPKLDDGELRMIFLHELAHVKRGDILLNWVIIFVGSLHWFNPLVWLALRRLRADRELVCDAMVMSRLSADERRAYGNTLVKLLDDFSAAGFCPSLVPVINHKHEIKRRVTMIAQFKPVGRVALLLSAVMVVALCCFTFTRAAEKPARKSADDTSNERRQTKVGRGIEALEEMLAEQSEKVEKEQAEVERRRKECAIPTEIARGNGENLIDSETIHGLEMSRIKAEAELKGMTSLLEKLKEKNARELEQVINVAVPDQNLTALLEAKAQNEQRIASATVSLGPNTPEVKSLAASQVQIADQIKNRIAGIISGLEVKVSVTKAQMESLAKAVDETRSEAFARERMYRPYFVAKRQLEDLEKLRDAIRLRILQEKIDMQIPRVRPVEK